MSRIPLVDPDHMNDQQRRQYDRFPSNLTLGLLLTDQRLSEALPNLANALRASSLDPKLREAAIVRVATLQGSAYEQMQHAGQVREVGWSDAEVEAIKAGQMAALPDDVAVVLDFVDQTVATGQVDDATFARVQHVLEPREIAAVILLVGHYMMVARFTAILEIDLDAQADNWTHEH